MATEGAENSTGRTPEDTVRRPVRNMDDIARLFLSGAREQEAAPSPAVQSSTGNADIKTAPAAETRAKPAIRDGARPVVQVAMTAATGAAAWTSIAAAAQHLAAEWECSIGVVGMHEGVMRILRAGETKCGATAIAGSAAGAPDLQLARVLVGMQENVSHWIIALPLGRSADIILAAVRDWLLVAGTDNESIVSAYRILKNVMAADPLDEPRSMRLFLACEDYASAAVAHARLARAVREFLRHELPLTGLSGRSAAPLETIAELKVGLDDGAVWASVAEFIHDLTGVELESDLETDAEAEVEAVLGNAGEAESDIQPRLKSTDHFLAESSPSPKERASIAPGDRKTPSENGPEIVARPNGATEPTKPAASSNPNHPPSSHQAIASTEISPLDQEARGASWNRQWDEPSAGALPRVEKTAPESTIAAAAPPSGLLRAVEVQTVSDDVRWNVIAASAGELCLGDPLEARPPGTERAAVWLDRAGKLHVWVLSEGSANWLAVWQWARQHRQLLALTRRDRWVDAAAEITMHVVLADGIRGKMAELPGIHWYRLALVRWGEKVGAVVIPA